MDDKLPSVSLPQSFLRDLSSLLSRDEQWDSKKHHSKLLDPYNPTTQYSGAIERHIWASPRAKEGYGEIHSPCNDLRIYVDRVNLGR